MPGQKYIISIKKKTLVSCALLLAGLTPLPGADASPKSPTPAYPGVGTTFTTLTVGATVYRNVRVRTVTARTVMIVHADGLTSILLRNLTPELQVQFGYDPDAEADAQAKLERAHLVTEHKAGLPTARPPSKPVTVETNLERLLKQFGTPPDIGNSVDLRPRFRELELTVKDQGRRPSCAIFAITSALEFQNAEQFGKPEKFSEDYLLWATRKTSGHSGTRADEPTMGTAQTFSEKDEGYTLAEVIAALRAYGIPRQSDVPNTFGNKIDDIQDPSPEIVALSRGRLRVDIHPLPGTGREDMISNVISALNCRFPVVISLRWPYERGARTGFLDQQPTMPKYAHAVTLVGYRCETGRIEDALFAFKNSYGPSWGMGGYGQVSYHYLKSSLLEATVLEVKSPTDTEETAPKS